jgi:hypothetical protein
LHSTIFVEEVGSENNSNQSMTQNVSFIQPCKCTEHDHEIVSGAERPRTHTPRFPLGQEIFLQLSKEQFLIFLLQQTAEFDVHGSVHHGIIHIEITNKTQHCIKIDYSIFK